MSPVSPISTPQRLLIAPLRYIGDTVLTVPLARNLRRLFPQAQIDWLASPATEALMTPCPYLSHVLPEPPSTAASWQLLRQNRYDTVFNLRKSASFSALCKLAGVKTLVGYDKQRFPWGYRRWGWFADRIARYPTLDTDVPQAISHLSLLTAAGLPLGEDHLELWTTPADEANLSSILAAQGVPANAPLAVLHAASASHGKQIALEKFADSLRHLSATGWSVLSTGTAADRASYEALATSSGTRLINLAGKTTLRETVALYRRIGLLLTVDSSPIHLGAAAGVPHIVGVFGPTNERQWGPHAANVAFHPVFRNLPCRPCYAKVCSHNQCREQLTAAQIAQAVQSALPPAP